MANYMLYHVSGALQLCAVCKELRTHCLVVLTCCCSSDPAVLRGNSRISACPVCCNLLEAWPCPWPEALVCINSSKGMASKSFAHCVLNQAAAGGAACGLQAPHVQVHHTHCTDLWGCWLDCYLQVRESHHPVYF